MPWPMRPQPTTPTLVISICVSNPPRGWGALKRARSLSAGPLAGAERDPETDLQRAAEAGAPLPASVAGKSERLVEGEVARALRERPHDRLGVTAGGECIERRGDQRPPDTAAPIVGMDVEGDDLALARTGVPIAARSVQDQPPDLAVDLGREDRAVG